MRRSGGTKIERRTLADGTVKTYIYKRKKRAPAGSKTVAGVITAWQDSPEWEALRPATTANYVRYIHPLFQAFKNIEIRKLRREHLMGVRDIVAKKRGHGAAAGYCAAVSALYKWARDHGIMDFSPATGMRRKLRAGELPTWTEAQGRHAMQELPEPYRRLVVLAYHTGQRRGDLCAMKWSDYDGTAIRLRQQKTGTALEIPVSPELRAELESWKLSGRTTVTILTAPNGTPWRAHYLSRMLPGELAKIGLPALNIHGLRKLMAVRLAEAGATAHEIAAITGHKTLSMVQLYTKQANQRTLANVAILRLNSDKGKNQGRL